MHKTFKSTKAVKKNEKKINSSENLSSLISRASLTYKKNFSDECTFERAIFLSWYCSKGDCKFCFMSTQKDKIKKVPLNLAKRRIESLITEAIICRELGWNIEFLSGGYDSYSTDELVNIARKISIVYGKKLWLNTGLLTNDQIRRLRPHTEGICGSIECLDPRLHADMCPSKPIEPIADMLIVAKSLRLKAGITIIIGLGESIKDFALLKDFIKKYDIDRITFYALNPHESTIFKSGPKPGYYAEWIALTRINFPKLEIIAGSWVDRLSEISLLLNAGANNITKFPSTSMFNSKFAEEIENQVRIADRRFIGTLTKLPRFDWNKIVDKLPAKEFNDDLKGRIKIKILSYIKMMKKKKK